MNAEFAQEGIFIGRQTRVEVAWRKLVLPLIGGGRAFSVARRTVNGRDELMALAGALSMEAWNGELRLRLGSSPPFYTHVSEVAHWRVNSASPRERSDTLWAAEAVDRAAKAAFLSRLRPVVLDAAGSRLVHPRDAQVLLSLARTACDRPISLPA